MAVSMRPTPALRGREAKKFIKKINEDLAKPLKSTAAPCLDAAKKLVFANADSVTKHCR